MPSIPHGILLPSLERHLRHPSFDDSDLSFFTDDASPNKEF